MTGTGGRAGMMRDASATARCKADVATVATCGAGAMARLVTVRNSFG
jgi:hypothetical protein